jgi:hypothetical protein
VHGYDAAAAGPFGRQLGLVIQVVLLVGRGRLLLLELVVLVLAELGGLGARGGRVGGVVGGFLGGGSEVRLEFDARLLRMRSATYPEDMLMALSDLLIGGGEVVVAIECLFAK